MYLAVFSYPNGDVEYCGPFLTESRAMEYATIWHRAFPKISRWHIAPLTVPHNEWHMGLAIAKAETKRIGSDQMIIAVSEQRGS